MKDQKPKIRYSQSWEDTELMLRALNIEATDHVLSISSGGCNSLAIAGCNPNVVYSIDSNSSQTYITQLKYTAIQHLSYDEYIEFIGITKSEKSIALFEKIRSFLENDCQQYWTNNQEFLKKGIIHCGNFEKYLHFFASYILPLTQHSSTLEKILNVTDKIEQEHIYKTYWNNCRWRILCKIFFNKAIMQLKGRSSKMFRFNQKKNTGQIYLERAQHALMYGNVSQNPYLEYILRSNYYSTKPYYLQATNFENCKNYKNLNISTTDVLTFLHSMPNESLSKFNLSDIFEAMTETETASVFREILRTSQNGARLIFWNNLVDRNIPFDLSQFFNPETDLENSLKEKDKVFFYERFYIYTIIK